MHMHTRGVPTPNRAGPDGNGARVFGVTAPPRAHSLAWFCREKLKMRCCSKDDTSDDVRVREARLRNQHQIASASSSDDEGSTTTVTETTERRRRARDVGRERRRGGSNEDDDDNDARDRRGGSDFDDLEAGGGFDDERDSYFEAGVGGRRSAWDRAAEQGQPGGSRRDDASPTHSTFGRDSERNRRMRKTARLVAERLGGIDSDEDDDEFEPGLGAPADVEQGFGFVSKDDVLKRREEMERQKREEEERRAEKARRKAEKKKAKRDEREKRARFTETESETVSLLEGRENDRRRKRSFFTRGSRAGNVLLAVVAMSAVIASAVGVILYAPTSSPKTVEIRGTDDGVLTTADPSLHPLKATTDKILHHLKHFTKKSDDEEKEKEKEKADADADALEKEKKKDDDSLVDDDEERDAEAEEASKKSHEHEATLGAKKASEPEIYATSSCAPVHRDSKHGIYNQFNSACYHNKDLIGCIEPTVGGCQKCYLADSAAASQKGSYVHCSHHVCKTYNVKGCLAEPQKVEDKVAAKGESPKHDVTLSKIKRKAVPSASRVSHFESDAEDEIESCLPNLEDAKRGVFQYSERSCRTLGHSDVDYSGCIAVGKSSCRMCVTRSALRTSTFSLCPKSVCHHHDLLFQQCAGEEDQVDDEDEDDDLR